MSNNNPRLGYYRKRNERLVSFVLEDVELKRKLEAVAEAEGRSVNNWIAHYIVPKLEAEMDAQLAKKPKGR